MRADSAAPDKPKYVLLSPWPVKAGTGVNNVILGLAAAMAERYRPSIAVTGWDAPPADQVWVKLPDPFGSLKGRIAAALYFLPNMLRFRRVLRGAVAVNPHFPGLELLPLVLLRILRLAPPLILSVHGADVTAAQQSSGIRRSFYSWLYARADVVVACSNALAGSVAQISPAARVTAIWNGVSKPPLFLGNRPLSAPYLISVAAFVRKKGHDVLLRAFRQVAAVHPEINLALLGGDGPEREPIIGLIASLGLQERVHIHLNVPHEETWNWLRHAECFALASRDEPFGIAVLEAATVRTPVVATRVGGISEFLSAGVHGLLCEPDRPDELAAAILQILDAPETARTRAEAFYRHASQFTWEAALEKYRRAAHLP